MGTAWVCWLVATSVWLGNTFFQANCFAGGIAAIMLMPGLANATAPQSNTTLVDGFHMVESTSVSEGELTGIRIGCSIAYAVIVLTLLFWDKTDKLGIFLGMVMMGMVALFLVVVVKIGIAGKVEPSKYDNKINNLNFDNLNNGLKHVWIPG